MLEELSDGEVKHKTRRGRNVFATRVYLVLQKTGTVGLSARSTARAMKPIV